MSPELFTALAVGALIALIVYLIWATIRKGE